MYILADKFIGNIKNTKLSYMKGNNFYYTNDGNNYKKMEISKNHIYDGYLEKFYTYVNIYPWIKEDTLSKYYDTLDKKTNRLYLEIHINNNNELTHVYTVEKNRVDFNKCIESNEYIIPMNNSVKEKVKVFSSNEGTMILSNDDIKKDIKLNYTINICFSDMFYREDIKQYVFKNKTLFEYDSELQLLSDYIY